MASTVRKSEKLLNISPNQQHMNLEEFNALEPREQWKIYEGYLSTGRPAKIIRDFIEAHTHKDGTPRLGPTDDCLTIPEMEAYVHSVLLRGRKASADQHFEGCAECAGMLEGRVEDLRQNYSQNPAAIFYRKAMVLYHYLENLLEQRQHQGQPQQIPSK